MAISTVAQIQLYSFHNSNCKGKVGRGNNHTKQGKNCIQNKSLNRWLSKFLFSKQAYSEQIVYVSSQWKWIICLELDCDDGDPILSKPNLLNYIIRSRGTFSLRTADCNSWDDLTDVFFQLLPLKCMIPWLFLQTLLILYTKLLFFLSFFFLFI